MNIIPDDEVLFNTKDRIFVVSLPRTGTKSLIKMLRVLGIRAEHCPSIRLQINLLQDQFDAYADTPIYRPSIFSKLAQQPSNKFIFIDRDVDSWLKSFEGTKLHNSYRDYQTRDYATMHRVSKLDRDSYLEVFGEAHVNPETNLLQTNYWNSDQAKYFYNLHKTLVTGIIPANQLLVYNFTQGWTPLCQFLGKEVPSEDVPQINKGTLFEKIV